MHPTHIAGMLRALQPALKRKKKGEQLLKSYWQDRMALVWTIDQVQRAANEKKTVLTNDEARKILYDLFNQHNHQYGIKWEDLTTLILESGLGRDINRRELQRFIHKDIIAIQKSKNEPTS